ncbi:hypothetical protein [Kitasatospora sp. NPDC088346]|uniref:hypothetical protein n=1 Tax=Kitasatospora sp. NPDC088346 TaxID=3364073 RepID=UPI0038061573
MKMQITVTDETPERAVVRAGARTTGGAADAGRAPGAAGAPTPTPAADAPTAPSALDGGAAPAWLVEQALQAGGNPAQTRARDAGGPGTA